MPAATTRDYERLYQGTYVIHTPTQTMVHVVGTDHSRDGHILLTTQDLEGRIQPVRADEIIPFWPQNGYYNVSVKASYAASLPNNNLICTTVRRLPNRQWSGSYNPGKNMQLLPMPRELLPTLLREKRVDDARINGLWANPLSLRENNWTGNILASLDNLLAQRVPAEAVDRTLALSWELDQEHPVVHLRGQQVGTISPEGRVTLFRGDECYRQELELWAGIEIA